MQNLPFLLPHQANASSILTLTPPLSSRKLPASALSGILLAFYGKCAAAIFIFMCCLLHLHHFIIKPLLLVFVLWRKQPLLIPSSQLTSPSSTLIIILNSRTIGFTKLQLTICIGSHHHLFGSCCCNFTLYFSSGWSCFLTVGVATYCGFFYLASCWLVCSL